MNKLTIVCPNNFIYERKYIISLIIREFLGFRFELFFDSTINDYTIEAGGKKVIIEDHFFNKYSNQATYISKSAIPNKITFIDNSFTKNLPAIYGSDSLNIEGNLITIGFDIFASAFFMLTRWEEDAIKKGNNIRCNESELLAVKFNFFQRPVVNEYCKYLINILNAVGIEITVNKRKTMVFITHDVDWCYLSTKRELIGNLAKMVFMKGLIKKSFAILMKYIVYKISNINPFDSFEELMELTNKYGFKNHFYFKAVKKGEKGYTYDINDKRVKTYIKRIVERRNYIGFHPSENTVDNDEQFEEELSRLKKLSNTNIEGGRNHGLLYTPFTYLQWENNYLRYDSGMGFQYRNGFRSGTCYEYKLFDQVNRRDLNLTEIPMLVMDSIAIRNKIAPEDYFDEVKNIFDNVNHHNGIFCMNWHSNLFNELEMKKYKLLYSKILSYINKEVN